MSVSVGQLISGIRGLPEETSRKMAAVIGAVVADAASLPPWNFTMREFLANSRGAVELSGLRVAMFSAAVRRGVVSAFALELRVPILPRASRGGAWKKIASLASRSFAPTIFASTTFATRI